MRSASMVPRSLPGHAVTSNAFVLRGSRRWGEAARRGRPRPTPPGERESGAARAGLSRARESVWVVEHQQPADSPYHRTLPPPGTVISGQPLVDDWLSCFEEVTLRPLEPMLVPEQP